MEVPINLSPVIVNDGPTFCEMCPTLLSQLTILCSEFCIPESSLPPPEATWSSAMSYTSAKKTDQTAFHFPLLTRSSTKLLAPFPDSMAQVASGGSAHSNADFLCSNQDTGCPPFSARQQFSPWESLVLSRWNSVCCMVFPEFSRLLESTTQLLSLWI